MYDARRTISLCHFYLVIIGEHAVLTIDNTSYKIAFLVGISYTLLVYDSLRRSREIIPYRINTCLNSHYLFYRHRCTSITLHTALTLASTEITTKLLRQNL